MKKKLLLTSVYVFIMSTLFCLNYQKLYATVKYYSSSCLPAEISIVEIDAENGIMTIEINSDENQVTIYAQDENGDYVYTELVGSGTFEIPYFEDAIYTAATVCSNGTLLLDDFLESCPPPEIEIIAIDEENGTATFNINSESGSVVIDAVDEEGNSIEGFPMTAANGNISLYCNENITYTVESECINETSVPIEIDPCQFIGEVIAVVDLMEISSEEVEEICNQDIPFSFVSYTWGTSTSAKIASKDCWCKCMNVPSPNPKHCYSFLLNHPDTHYHPSLSYSPYNPSLYYHEDCYKKKLQDWSIQGKTSLSLLPSNIQFSPNPFTHTFNLELDLPKETLVSIQVYNILGQPIADLSQEGLYSSGTSRLSFDTSHLASGLYLFMIRMNGEEQLIKATKL